MAPMNFVFIGMSGVGKSYWAHQLAQLRITPFTHYDCDALIAQRLGKLIDVSPGEQPVHAVGRWMGMPWSEGYEQREAEYLAVERDVTAAVMEQLRECPTPNWVVDTTGSVVYLGGELLARLPNYKQVVYFDVPDDVRQQMVELYLREPKPVLWQGMYRPRGDESRGDALARCYADLLVDRADRYRAMADVIIDYHAVREPGFDVLGLVNMCVL